MTITTSARLRRLGVGGTSAAIVAAGLLLTSPAHAAAHVVTSHLVDQSETRATGHNVFGEDGVRVYTEGATSTDKAAGYFDVDIALADAGEPRMSWSNNLSSATGNLRPSVQLKTDFDGNGSIDGILVGEPTYADGTTLYGNDWWLSGGSKTFVKDAAPSHAGGSGSENHGTLDQWRAAFEDAQVIQAGWSLGSGVKGDGTINSVTVGDAKYYFTESASVTNVKLYAGDVDTSSTRAKGHNEFRPTSGVNVYTDSITDDDPGDAGHYAGYVNKAAGFFDIDEALRTVGEPTMDYRTISGAISPGLWLNLDVDGDGDADGTLIKERAYGNDWWLNDTDGPLAHYAPINGGGSGSNLHGSLAEWRASLPADTTVATAGWSLGAGVEGSFIVDHITVGLKRYGFTGANVAPTAGAATISVKAGQSIETKLRGADKNGDDLTYTIKATHGTAVVTGDTVRFTAPTNYHGWAYVDYTVTDGRGGSAENTFRYSVGRASSSTRFTVSPTKLTSKSKVTVNVTVTSTGNKYRGIADVYNGSKKVGSGRIHTNGTQSIALTKKLSKGTHTITVKYRGTAYTSASQHSIKVKVK